MTKAQIFRFISLFFNIGLSGLIIKLALHHDITSTHIFALTGLTLIAFGLTFTNHRLEAKAKKLIKTDSKTKEIEQNDSINR